VDAVLAAQGPVWAPFLGPLSALTPLRALAAPLLFLGFVLAAVFAPARSPRVLLLVAAAVEAVLFVWFVYLWTHPPG
jgi:hypothetical protein